MSDKFNWNRHNEPKNQWPEKDYDWTDSHTVPAEHKGHTGKIFAIGMVFALAVLPGYLAHQEAVHKTVGNMGHILTELPNNLRGVHYQR